MGRKRKAAEALDGEPSHAGSELELRWEWEKGAHGWLQFPPEQSEALSQAARAGKLSVDIGESRVDLRRMVQRDKQTGLETRVAAAVRDQDSYLVWQWKGDQEDDWLPYPADTCLALQAARSGHGEPTVEVMVGRTSYKLDTIRMVQTNNRTKFERQIECRESDAAEVTDGGSQLSNSTPGDAGPTCTKKVQNRVAKAASQGEGDSTESVKTVILKGKAPVDPQCAAKVGKAHVYCEGEDIYDIMLNQTNLQFNNNKYYLIQLLEDDGVQNYSVWMRWGRVGKPGQHSLVSCGGDLAKAKDVFTKKFLDKTKNEWTKRSSFQKVAGKYDILHLDYEASDADEKEAPQKSAPRPKPVSQLDPRVQALVELICSIRTMEEMVMEMKYDTRKAPLGKLTAEQIQAGYQSLQKVEACLKRKQPGRALLEACNEFYTRIPHDFGLKTPPLINTEQELREKMQLLEALGEIRVAIKLVRSDSTELEHPLDRSYRGLGCELQPLDREGPDFQVLERYLLSTHAPTHTDYTMTLLEAFILNKETSGSGHFRSDLPNRTLLWHGSRLGNWAGILSQGLRVAPPEAPVTGYMFGKGIYFADMSSKSANYCFATRERDIGLLLLSEVALGECNELLEANPDAEKLPAGKHSTKGLGKLAPSPSNSVVLHGATVPLGPAVETGVVNPSGYTLKYNEFIVYDPCQVRLKYLLKVHFNFTELW
ncbi:poly [ADP-ribose] polymerase 2 isoform X2 [Varanus komodoensis]|nr:poly [ADP-ribose] polymerase 2 isoform X2 [Varanus komodoensis]XP_044278302.1 poly [ADP-ribose] polymerase 2 isoform X2 [Varanus komodoensis]